LAWTRLRFCSVQTVFVIMPSTLCCMGPHVSAPPPRCLALLSPSRTLPLTPGPRLTRPSLSVASHRIACTRWPGAVPAVFLHLVLHTDAPGPPLSHFPPSTWNQPRTPHSLFLPLPASAREASECPSSLFDARPPLPAKALRTTSSPPVS
jgi:hypothetical protein